MSVKEFLSDVKAGYSRFERHDGSDVVWYRRETFSCSPSSGAINSSNVEAIYERLENVDIDHVGHDIRGNLRIEIYGADGNFTMAIEECAQIDKELADYAIIDEVRYSKLREEYCADHVYDFEDEARELIEGGDAAEIEKRSEITVDGKKLIADKDRDAAVIELAYALAETAFID